MKKSRIASFAFLVVPLLNSGCIQHKSIAVKPSIDKKISNSSRDNNLTSKPDTNSTKSSHLDKNRLNQLAFTIKNIMDNNQSSDFFTEPTVIEDNWVEISKEEEIILTAQEFMGAKYVWAANGPECFDCSGFTRYVFRKHGVTLPRYSGNQAKVGTTVTYNELEIGDLVFFDTEKKYKEKVNHVGIYIGDHKFIHASSAKKKVIITSFKKKQFYKNRFLWGQRIINSNTYASL
jgi:cell wall-associated NlpC family hydrolase